MQLVHLPLSTLHLAKTNMRYAEKDEDVSDLLPTIRKRGILQPLLVRPNNVGHAIEAGRRRYLAAKIIAAERNEDTPIPCGILDESDDAAAIEASLIENICRKDADEMTEYETYSRLIKEGQTVDEIAATFGLEVRRVEQRLALARLAPRIRDLYRARDIDVESIRALTMASKRQQKEWLALHAKGQAPTGRALRAWLCGGAPISVKVALFPLDSYTGPKATDLFEDKEFFGDVEQFWQLQNAAIAEKRDTYLARGWTAVEILDIGRAFETWNHEKATKKAGGKVFIVPNHDGSVSIHEGYLSRAEARRKASKREVESDESEGEGSAPVISTRPELTSWQTSYVNAHKQAAVRAALVSDHGVAFRLLIAHAIGGAVNVRVTEDHLIGNGKETADSVRALSPHQAYEQAREAASRLVGLDPDRAALTGSYGSVVQVFERLMELSDAAVLQVAAVLMAEALATGSDSVDAAGQRLGVDLKGTWKPDDAFWAALRDKRVIGAMLAEVAGKEVADANLTATGKVKKGILQDALGGKKGRKKAPTWLPKWLAFPAGRYIESTEGQG
jgi:ParB family chromosome partitioning protein